MYKYEKVATTLWYYKYRKSQDEINGGVIWGKDSYYESDDKYDERFIFLFFIPIFFLMLCL
jgi:hypothetical protein